MHTYVCMHTLAHIPSPQTHTHTQTHTQCDTNEDFHWGTGVEVRSIVLNLKKVCLPQIWYARRLCIIAETRLVESPGCCQQCWPHRVQVQKGSSAYLFWFAVFCNPDCYAGLQGQDHEVRIIRNDWLSCILGTVELFLSNLACFLSL